MRERMDFASISRIIIENWNAEGLANTEYFYRLFFYAFQQEQYKITEPDHGDISRYLNGQRGIPKEIIRVYQAEENSRYLRQGVAEVLKYTADIEYVKEQAYTLLQNDATISYHQRNKLADFGEETELFLSNCLLFGLSRKFLPRDNDGKIKHTIELSDFLLDYHIPSVGKVFVGRDREMNEIHERMEGNDCLFLTGIGGIGKSELAKQYIKLYKKEYENVIYLRYTESLKKTIAGLNFVDDNWEMSEERRFTEHYKFFKRLNSATLVILDNFDTVPEKEPLFHDFVGLPFRLLVTTRSHIEDVPMYQVEEIADQRKLLDLFYAYRPQSKDRENTVIEIIEEVYCHTLTVEMAAKTLKAACMEPEELLIELRREGIKLSNPNKIPVTKDAETKKERLYCHIQTLFQIQKLTEAYKNLLRYMTLMPEQGVLNTVFHKWLQTNDYNDISDLSDLGWVQMDADSGYISLHPMIHEVVKAYEQPGFLNCGPFLRGVFMDCFCFGLDLPYYRDILNSIESIYQNIVIDDLKAAYLFMESTLNYLEKYGNIDGMERILDFMEQYIQIDRRHRKEAGLYYCYRGGVAMRREDNTAALRLFQNGIIYAEPVNAEFAELASNLYCNISSVYAKMGNFKECKENISKALKVRKKYDLPFNQNAIVQVSNYVQVMAISGRGKEAISYLERCITWLEGGNFNVEVCLGQLYMIKGGIEKMIMNMPQANSDLKLAIKYLASSLPPGDQRLKDAEDMLHASKFSLIQKY